MVTKHTVRINLDCVSQLEIGQAGDLLNHLVCMRLSPYARPPILVVSLSFCLFVVLSGCPTIRPSDWLYVCLSACLIYSSVRPSVTHTYKFQTDRQTDIHRDRQIFGWAYRQTDGHTYISTKERARL